MEEGERIEWQIKALPLKRKTFLDYERKLWQMKRTNRIDEK